MAETGQSGQLGFTFQSPAAARRIWTPRTLMSSARTQVEREYGDIWVEGEVSNFRPAESGHLYFTLKDDDAQLRVVMFRTQARLLRFRPENGLHVLARGRVTIYEARGELQLSAEYLEPKGAGALQIAFEQLKARLQAEGLFDQERKKQVPALPKRIGVVTSPRGAAVQDILNILRRRHVGVNVVIYPAQVQGEAAAAEVGTGIKYFNRIKDVDVIIVARGGGSMEDLAGFNDEALARTIAGSHVPVISAIGHETDFTIADFVADLRAPTPSAAAELVIQSRNELEDAIGSLCHRLSRGVRYQLMLARQALNELAQHGAMARVRDVIGRRQQRLDDLTYRLSRAYESHAQQKRRRLEVAATRLRHFDLRRVLGGMRREIDAHSATLHSAMRNFLLRRAGRLGEAVVHLESLSPVKILDRGYALIFDATGRLVKDPAQVKSGDEITARVAQGAFGAIVKKG
ncbi:MAG TPA: exodeoxyribonuclease VII large subunit [Terriglobales bacterium]|jgi:exodeoxyribonuclease VII large subunit|nr:exodeoxyribonuclease VII large subunit [Terriglobales bacterium]